MATTTSLLSLSPAEREDLYVAHPVPRDSEPGELQHLHAQRCAGRTALIRRRGAARRGEGHPCARGAARRKGGGAFTESIVMRSKSGTVRKISSELDFTRKTGFRFGEE